MAAAAVVGIAGTPAYAHNQLTSSSPENGEVLDEAPSSVTLDFLASLDPDTTTVTVTGPDDTSAAAGPPEFDGSTVTVPLQVTAAGRYTVDYEVLASDGDLGTGQIAFELTPEAAPAAPPDPTTAAPAAAAGREAATPSATDAVPQGRSATSAESSSSPWPWVTGAVVLLVVGAAAAVLVSARRRGTPSGPGAGAG